MFTIRFKKLPGYIGFVGSYTTGLFMMAECILSRYMFERGGRRGESRKGG